MSSGLVAERIADPPSVATQPPVGPVAGRELAPLIAEYSAIYGPSWKPATVRKHRDDYRRLLDWLTETGRPTTTASLDFLTLAAYVTELRSWTPSRGVARGTRPCPPVRSSTGQVATLSANTINTYMRPIRSFAIWLVDEGILPMNPFRRSRRRAALNPLLPAEDTPTKGASLTDLRTLELGCAGAEPIDLRDRAILAVLVTTAARNSSVRLLRLDDVDLDRDLICFHRAKGDKTLEITLHPNARAAIAAYLEVGRPALVGTGEDHGYLFVSRNRPSEPLTMHALSLMLTRRYRAGGGSLPYFGSHRIRHATATILVNNGMPLEEVSRYLGHSSTAPTRRYAQQTPDSLGRRAAEALARAGLT